MWRDFILIIIITAGIFVNKSSTVRRFVTFEKSQVQQIQLTKIFNVATDGLVVLKE